MARFQSKTFLSDLRRSVATSQHQDAERDWLMERAPNAIEWITSPRYCDQRSLFRHWGQYRLVKEYFELRCPICNIGGVPANPWGCTQMQLESEILLRWNERDEEDKCPNCGGRRSEFNDQGFFHNYRYLTGIIGQRAGKSTILALMATYIEHISVIIAHTFPDGLYGYIDAPKGETFNITFVATNEAQGEDTIWAKYRGFRVHSPWFKKYIPWLQKQEKLQDTPLGMQKWCYAETDKTLSYGNFNFIIDVKNSNSFGLAGKTRLAAFIDEICLMKQTASGQGAREIYTRMDASCKNARTAVDNYGIIPWFGMIAAISSPMSVDDYGMQLLKRAQIMPQMYARQMASWEFCPWLPREVFADDFKMDPLYAMRNFGAQPAGATNPLIDREQEFREIAICKTLKPTATFIPFEYTDPIGKSMLGVRLLHANLITKGESRFITVDAGANFDAFTVCCAHAEKNMDGDLITVYDWVIRLLTRSRQQEVYFESIYQLLKELQSYIKIEKVEFDHWNSKAITQKIRQELQLNAEEIATKSEHFIQFMRDAYLGKVRLLPEESNDSQLEPPDKSAQGVAIYEILHLERDPKNDKVYNPHKGKIRGYNSDDCAHVIVHAHKLVQDSCGYTKLQHDNSMQARSARSRRALHDWEAQGRGGLIKIGGGSNPNARKW